MGIKSNATHEQKALTSNQQVTLQVPAYGRIQELKLRFTTAGGADCTIAQIRAEVGNIRLTMNGKDIVNASAAQLIDLASALGVQITVPAGINGIIELNVGRLFFLSPEIRDAFGYGTADVTTIQVTVSALTLTNVAAVQAFTVRDNINANLGAHCRIINYPQSFNATGDHTVDTLPRDPDTAYLSVLASQGASGAISFGEVRVNNVTIKERVPNSVNRSGISDIGMEQPTGYFNYLFNDGAPANVLPMVGVTDLRFITTFGTAPGVGGYSMLAVTVNGIQGLGK